MADDVKIEGLNISALLRNFDTLRGIVQQQKEAITLLRKDQRLCLSRISDLQKANAKKEDSAIGNLFGGHFGK